MSRFVLVHGAWHGAWCWEHVSTALRARGHTVAVPTLTGLGERAAGLDAEVSLSTHVDDIVAALDERDPCVLVGHSYAGLVVRAAADRLPAAVERMVLLDGWASPEGASLFALAPDWFSTGLRNAAAERGDGWRIPVPAAALVGVTDPEQARWVEERLTEHPLRTFEEAVPLSGAVDDVPGTAIVCRPGSGLPFEALGRALGYEIRDIACGHDVMVLAPDALTDLLEEEAA